MKAVILAAGEGTRLNKGWTIVPKPLLEIGDKTIIEHVISSLQEAGFTEIIIIVGFMSEHIKERLRDGVDYGTKIEYIYNKNYREDLVTSLPLIKEHVTGPFLLCMADLFFKSSVVRNLLEKTQDNLNYVCVDTKLQQVRRIEEKIKVQIVGDKVQQQSLVLPKYDAIDCGIYLLQDSIFDVIEKCLEQGKKSFPLVITELAINGQFKVHDIGEEEVVDVDREKDGEYVLKTLSKNVKK